LNDYLPGDMVRRARVTTGRLPLWPPTANPTVLKGEETNGPFEKVFHIAPIPILMVVIRLSSLLCAEAHSEVSSRFKVNYFRINCYPLTWYASGCGPMPPATKHVYPAPKKRG